MFLFAFRCVGNERLGLGFRRVLTCFSLFMQMVEGTSYVIVPFMIYLFMAILVFVRMAEGPTAVGP